MNRIVIFSFILNRILIPIIGISISILIGVIFTAIFSKGWLPDSHLVVTQAEVRSPISINISIIVKILESDWQIPLVLSLLHIQMVMEMIVVSMRLIGQLVLSLVIEMVVTRVLPRPIAVNTDPSRWELRLDLIHLLNLMLLLLILLLLLLLLIQASLVAMVATVVVVDVSDGHLVVLARMLQSQSLASILFVAVSVDRACGLHR